MTQLEELPLARGMTPSNEDHGGWYGAKLKMPLVLLGPGGICLPV